MGVEVRPVFRIVKQSPVIYSNRTATPMLLSLSIFLRSTLTTLPFLIRAKPPFSSAKAGVRGMLISTVWPARMGIVIGTLRKTPVLLMLELRP